MPLLTISVCFLGIGVLVWIFACDLDEPGFLIVEIASIMLCFIFFVFGAVVRTCPNCKSDCLHDYCTTCGHEMGTKETNPIQTCTSCGRETDEDWQFCGTCGAPVTPEE